MSNALAEEVEVLEAVYPGSFRFVGSNLYELTLPESDVAVRLSFPSQYPDEPPHVINVKGRLVEDVEVADCLDKVYFGDVCVLALMEELRELLQERAEQMQQNLDDDLDQHEDVNPGFEFWTAGEAIIDRKSVFIARAASVSSVDQACTLIDRLKLDRRIARATHNMTAYRIKPNDSDVMFQDCDDDGETAAGGRLLHLLQLTNALNVVVFVSRWYGGILLGPDRFKHINSAARDALVKGRFI